MQRKEKRNANGNSSSGKVWMIRGVIGAAQRDKSIRVRSSTSDHFPHFGRSSKRPFNLLLTSHPVLCPRSSSERLPSEPLVAAEAAAAHHHWPRFGLDDTRQLHTCSPVTPSTMLMIQSSQNTKTQTHKNTNTKTKLTKHLVWQHLPA